MRSAYDGIYFDLKRDIEEGVYAYKDLLPSESVLVKKYDCAHNTVRKALAILSRDGYVQAIHGKGVRVIYTPVARENKPFYELAGVESFAKTGERHGFTASTKVLLMETISADAPVKKRGRKKATPEIVAETVPPIEAETAVESVAVDTTAPETVVEVSDEPLPGQLAFDSDETPVAEVPAKKPRKLRAKKADTAPKRRGRPPKNPKPELVLTTTLQVGDAEFDISALAEKAYKEYKRVHKRKVVTDFHIYVKPEEGAAYYTVNGEGSEDFKIDLT